LGLKFGQAKALAAQYGQVHVFPMWRDKDLIGALTVDLPPASTATFSLNTPECLEDCARIAEGIRDLL
jgi:hypothetical protein